MGSTDSIPVKQRLHNQHHTGRYEVRPPRKRTYLIGKLVSGDGVSTLDCMIRDISEGGAKIILTRRNSLPPDAYLIVVKHCVAYQAKVMWLNFPARGLKFFNKYFLNEVLPKNLSFLRQLWVDLSLRSDMQPARSLWEAGELAARCDETR